MKVGKMLHFSLKKSYLHAEMIFNINWGAGNS